MLSVFPFLLLNVVYGALLGVMSGKNGANVAQGKRRKSGAIPQNNWGDIRIRHRPGRRKAWSLDYFVDGKRHRPGFESREEAEREQARLRELRKREGKQALLYDRADHAEFTAAKKLLPAGVSLVSVVEEWLELRGHAENVPSIGVALEEFLERKRQLERSGRHVLDLESRLRAFRDSILVELPDLRQKHVVDFLLGLRLGARTIKNYRSSIRNFLQFCCEEYGLRENVADGIGDHQLPFVRKRRKGVLSIDQIEAVLREAERSAPHLVFWFAVRFFLGFRSCEADIADVSWFDPEMRRVIVPAEICKTRDDWAIYRITEDPEQDLIWDWHERYCPAEGKIYRPKSDREWAYVVQRAGVSHWPQNASRNSFVTYHLSAFEKADKTALIVRHQSARRLYADYLAVLVAQSEGCRLFQIAPGEAGER